MMTYIFGLSLILATENGRVLGAERVSTIAKAAKSDDDTGLMSLALSKSGDFFATSPGGGAENYLVSIHDKQGRMLATQTFHKFEQGWVAALAFDPNNHERVFVATRHGLFAWDWKNKAKFTTVPLKVE